MIKRVLGGISTEEERLAVEVIERVGPGGNFLIDDLTLKYFRTERFFPSLLLRETSKRSETDMKGP
jgi:trimethylamine--corrinoid protein Co-methyltransferase